MSTIVVTGGRNFTDRQFIWSCLDNHHSQKPISLLIYGGARGVDIICHQWAMSRGVNTLLMPAQWEKHGRGAGFIRNLEMLQKPGVTCLLSFPGGNGTAHCTRSARKLGIPVRYYYPVGLAIGQHI